MKTPRCPSAAPLLKPPAQLISELIDGGLSQAEVSRRTGIPQPTVSRIQFGNSQSCALVNYAALFALYREHFSASKALEDSVREEVRAQVRAQLLAELSPTPPTPPSNNAAIAEIATE